MAAWPMGIHNSKRIHNFWCVRVPKCARLLAHGGSAMLLRTLTDMDGAPSEGHGFEQLAR